MSLELTIEQRQNPEYLKQIIAAWLAKPREYETCSEAVWDAHLELNGQSCEETDEPCPICFVYCEMCGIHYDREDTCIYH